MPAKKLIKKPTIAVPLFMIVSQSSELDQVLDKRRALLYFE
jgi:hypothetical protein